MNKLRKIFAASVMVMTVLAMCGFVAPKANAAAQAGDLIKKAGLSTVYYLASDGKRYVFPNQDTYFSWYSDFSGVVTVSATELSSYPLGGNVTMRAGTKLVKITSDPSVYAVLPNGILSKIQSESDAAALYGSMWSKRVVDVPDSFFTNYTIGTPLVSGTVPAGSLVKNSGSANVYYYDGTNYRMIANEAAMAANRFMSANVLTISNTITANGTTITGYEDALAKTSQSGTTGGIVAGAGTGLTVSLASNTAPSTTVIGPTAPATIGQTVAPLATFNFTASSDGPVTVTSLKVKRIGVSSDSALANVYLYNGSTRLTDSGSLSNSYVTFSNSTGLFTIPAGSTYAVTVKADIAGITGNLGMAINAASDVVTNGGSAISGSFPLQGNLMSMTSATDLATVAVGVVQSPGASINAGTMGATLWSAPFTVSQKAVNLNYIRFRMVGSINADALQNLHLFINGTQVGTTGTIAASDYVVFDMTANPILMSTGAQTVELRGDVIKGSSRTFMFNVQLASDVLLTDTNYGVNVAATGLNTNVTSTTIAPGSLSIQADPAFTTTQVVKSTSNIVLSQFTMKAYGEDMQVNNLITNLYLTGGAVATEGINNLAIYVNGGQVGSTQNFIAGTGPLFPSVAGGASGGSAQGSASFGTNNMFTVPAGQTDVIQIKGDLQQVPVSAINSVKANLVLNTNAAQGVSSVTSFPLGSPDLTPATQSLAVVSTSAILAVNSGYGSQFIVQNTPHQKIGSFILQTGSAEGIKITNIAVAIAATAPASFNCGTNTCAPLTSLNNLYITDNTTPVLPASTNNFPVNETMPANSTKTIDVFADLGTIPVNDQIITSMTVTGIGSVSNGTITQGPLTGQTLTLNTGALATPTLVTNDPNPSLVLGGSTRQIADWNFVSANGTANITDLYFNVTTDNPSVTMGNAIQSVTVAGQPGTVIPVGGQASAHISGLNIAIPAGIQGLDVPVTATFNNVTSAGYGGATTDSHVALQLTRYAYTVAGVTTDHTVTTPATGLPSNNFKLEAAIPTVNLASDNPAGMSSGYAGSGLSEVMRFTVANGTGNAINLKQIGLMPVYTPALPASNKINVYDKNDLNTVLNLATPTTLAGGSGSVVPVIFDNDQVINANTTREFVVKADTSGAPFGVGDSFRVDLTSNGVDLLNAGSTFQWNDSTVSGTYNNGYLVNNLPLTGSSFVH